MNINIKILLSKPVDEINDDELEEVSNSLPKKVIKLPKDEGMVEPGQNAKPFKYTVKAGDTLKKISEKFGVSYGELSNHLLNTCGTTSIHEKDEIEIPRHFIDLSQA